MFIHSLSKYLLRSYSARCRELNMNTALTLESASTPVRSLDQVGTTWVAVRTTEAPLPPPTEPFNKSPTGSTRGMRGPGPERPLWGALGGGSGVREGRMASCCPEPPSPPQLPDKILPSSGQIGGVAGHEVVGCLAPFPLPASQEEHLWGR